AGAVDLDLHARIRGLEELGHLLRARERQRRVPDDLALFLRGLQPGILSGGDRGRGDEREQHQGNDEPTMSHRDLLGAATFHAESASMSGPTRGCAASASTSATARAASASGMASAALSRNLATSSSRVIGKSGPPRG